MKNKYNVVGVNRIYLERDCKVLKSGDLATLPKTPSFWHQSQLELIPVCEILLTYGGGMGGTQETMFVKELPFDAFEPNKLLEVEVWDTNEKILINTNYLVRVKRRKLGVGYYHTDNHNFKVGDWKAVFLCDYEAKTIKTIDKY